MDRLESDERQSSSESNDDDRASGECGRRQADCAHGWCGVCNAGGVPQDCICAGRQSRCKGM
eukprot:scaffold138852_cov24-Tisochrysis_lutea.AAC.2